MAQKIVICSDGTGNAFTRQVSNVTRLVKCLDLSRPSEQVVFYDQGVGTDPALAGEVRKYRERRPKDRCALTVLDPPFGVFPVRTLVKYLGLAFGVGLKGNVKQLYKALADSYEDGPSGPSAIYLIGFSRGAFTVRVLAGLIHRCGLLRADHPRYTAAFDEAYGLYEPHTPDCDAIRRFREREAVRSPTVAFLGIWDTVKSYGGVWPKSLPHLRHNSSVAIVRHALALDEERSWFIPTSWGGIDSDQPVDPRDECPRPDGSPHPRQHVEEVWFRGSHSDVGGGLEDDTGSKAPLRWMLNEAARAGVSLSREGWEVTTGKDPTRVTPFPSLSRGWLVSEYIPRWELDNHYRPPKRYFKCGRSGKRHPSQFCRQQVVRLHDTVGAGHDIVAKYVETQAASRPPGSRRADELSTT